MYILGKKWRGEYLDYHRGKEQLRIQVVAWMVVEPVTEMYFERPRSIRLIREYVREIGPNATVRKIRSRIHESLRNKRFYSVGLGRVTVGPSGQKKDETAIAFIAPSHPRCVERIVLPSILTKTVDEHVVARIENQKGIVWCERNDDALLIDDLCGWQSESGRPLPEDSINRVIDTSLIFWNNLNVDEATILSLKTPTPVCEKTTSNVSTTRGLRAVLFGFGNYAKTVILGNIDSRIHIDCVHEIDPTQIGQVSNQPWSIDSSPLVRDAEEYDAYFIAGYHHTHADLAITSLKRGAYTIVEKPVVTSQEQLDRLYQALQQHPGKLFACFHMRYNPLFRQAIKDLGITEGEPVNYYCTVFEVSLPARHWYRWPSSCSHLVSNGCHWIDHFLNLNGYARPVEWHVWQCNNGDSHVGVELENGAVLGMFLTHSGSSRIGVQDHVELRANGRTVTVDCGSKYLAESSSKIIRKQRCNKMLAYNNMYQTISRKIINEEPGDTLHSLRQTHELMLALEKKYFHDHDTCIAFADS